MGDVVKRSDCILVYGSTTKADIVKRLDCILVYGSTTKADIVKRLDCIHDFTGKKYFMWCYSYVSLRALLYSFVTSMELTGT